MSTIGRRQFLYCIGGAGAAALSSLAASHPVRDAQPNLAVDAGTTDGHLRSVTRIGWAFGSTASITALHRERTICRRALSASFDELERVERLMSIYRANSQLSQLNRHRSLTDPDPLLVEILLTAQAFSEKTGGAFDVTIQPLWQLYADMHRDGRLPSEADARAAHALVDWRRVEVTPERRPAPPLSPDAPRPPGGLRFFGPGIMIDPETGAVRPGPGRPGQFREFIVPGAEIHMVGAGGQKLTSTLEDLLPRSFGPEFLPG